MITGEKAEIPCTKKSQVSFLSRLTNFTACMVSFRLKSLSPLFFFCFWRKVKSSIDTNSKKQLNFLRLSLGFDRKKIKIWPSRSRTGTYDVVPVTCNINCALPAPCSSIEKKLGLSYNFFLFNFSIFFLVLLFFKFFLFKFVYYPTGFVWSCKQTSSGILTRYLRGTSFIHKLIVQKHVPVRVWTAKHPQEIRAGYNVKSQCKKSD